MEHLTALDASFLAAEDSDPHVSLAVGGDVHPRKGRFGPYDD